MANEQIIQNGIIFNTGVTDNTASFNAVKLTYSGSATDYTSFIISGSRKAKFYFSGSTSGKIGIGTTDPTNDVDIKTDTFKIRSADGTKEIEFGEEGQLKTRKFSGVGGGGALEATGSELVMSYSPGTFASPVRARAGDLMGSIRWEDESFSEAIRRKASTPMKIDGIVTAADSSGIGGYMSVKTTEATDVGPTETLGIRAAGLYVTGSLNVSSNTTIVGNVTTKGWVKLGNALADTATFTGNITASGNISASGNIIVANGYDLYTDQIRRASDSSTTTKINLQDEELKLYAGHSSNEIVNIQNKKVSINTNVTASGNISSSGNIYAAAIKATLPAGVDNSVVVLDADGFLKTDEIDGGVWGGGGALVTAENIADTISEATLVNGTFSGDVTVGGRLIHSSDTDTLIAFTADDINITVGNVNMLDFTQNDSADDEVTFNEAGADLDFRIESVNDSKAIYIDASKNAIQLGSGRAHVTASGNISASGNIYAKNLILDSASTSNISASKFYAAEGFYHSNDVDEDTYIKFPTGDKVKITAGDVNFMYIWQKDSDVNKLWFNYDKDDTDIVLRGDTDDFLIYTDASTDRVGIGTGTPAQKLTVAGNVSASGTISSPSASFSKLQVTDTNIVGRRHILWQSAVYINDNPYEVDKGYFGSSIGNTPSNWNDTTEACFNSSAGTFVNQVDITEDQHGAQCFFAPFDISRIEALSSWRTAGTGDDEGFWCGIWTGSAGVRLGNTSGAHNTTHMIGFLTGSKHVFSNGGNWEGQNLDLDVSVSLPAFTKIYFGHGTTETSGVGSKQSRGHITLMVYEA